jgi:exosortase E/protease (VPEID-CTERM system)
MRALLAKYVGASHLSTRLHDLWRLFLVVPLVFFEIFFTTALFDFYLPADFPVWENPVLYTNVLAKVTVLASLLLVLVAWPRREEIGRRYAAAGADGLTAGVLANVALFAALLGCKFLLSTAPQPSFGLLLSYSLVFLATGASMALALAPLAFWRDLVKLGPVEIMLAFAVAVVVAGAAALAQAGWDSLSGATLTLSHWFLSLYEADVVLIAAERVLGVGDFKVQVYGPCSGYEGVALLLAFLSVYVWVFRHDLRFPNVLLLFPIGVSIIWTLNALRIAVLVSIGGHISPDIAIQGFHSAAGWIAFLFVTLSCIAVSRRFAFFAAVPAAEPAAPRAAAPAQPALVFLAPFMALLGASILESAFAPHDQWLYGVKVAAIACVLWYYRHSYTPLLRSVSPSSVAIGFAVGVAWIATDPNQGSETALGVWIASLPLWTAAIWIGLRAIGSVALVPIAEELAFRGYLARVLVSAKFENVGFGEFRWLAFIASSLAFGLVHQRWLAAFLAGAIYALLMYRTKRLSDPIAAHAASNATLILWAVVAQQWSLL